MADEMKGVGGIPDALVIESKRLIPLLQSFAQRLVNNIRLGHVHPELFEADHDTLMETVQHLKQIQQAAKRSAQQ